MTADLRRFTRDGWLRRVDAELGELVLRVFPESAPEVGLAAALAARAIGEGHSALQLDGAQAWLSGLDGHGEPPTLPDPHSWIAALRDSSAVASNDDPASDKLLVLDARGRVYLKRYFDYEMQLAEQLIARASAKPLLPEGVSRGSREMRSNASRAGERLDQGGSMPGCLARQGAPSLATEDESNHAKLFVSADPEQARAAQIALRNHFALITGGPGTGKTSSVVRIVALLAQRAFHQSRELRIALAAPTGKAAARLAESVRTRKAALALPPEIAAMIPDQATTLHALLGLSPQRTQAKYRRDAPLPYHAVIVDEVSMVDLPLMTKLVDAVAPDARLVLLGDPRQLAAVEAGDVLGALVEAADESPLRGCAIDLTRSHRFDAHGALGRLAAAIAAGDPAAAIATFDRNDELGLIEGDVRGIAQALIECAIDAYRDVLDASDPRDALAAARQYRVLTALRRGPLGCVALNQAIEQRLKRLAGVHLNTAWWRGRLLMVTANRAGPGLFNGDIGVVWPDADGNMKLWFEGNGGDGALRVLSPAALPPHEGAFALTVHKAQGSEFERVALVLGNDSPVLTRELLYTGVTRARTGVVIYGDAALLRAGIARRTLRWNGLADRLREAACTSPQTSIAESLPAPP
ncbi:MAG: exodeoxyribonuclease V subunit alpha [Rhodanobacteraceae bacterium]